jgi:hypothetical protein
MKCQYTSQYLKGTLKLQIYNQKMCVSGLTSETINIIFLIKNKDLYSLSHIPKLVAVQGNF